MPWCPTSVACVGTNSRAPHSTLNPGCGGGGPDAPLFSSASTAAPRTASCGCREAARRADGAMPGERPADRAAPIDVDEDEDSDDEPNIVGFGRVPGNYRYR